jgi:hypothetical protein
MDVLRALFFNIISIKFNSLVPATILLVRVSILYSPPLLLFLNNLIITPKPFPTEVIFEGSKEVEN